MLISKKIHIHMGHRIPNHKSKCRNLHGHTYTIEVGVNDKVITTKDSTLEGMVIDYSDLKDIIMKEIDIKLDHGFMVYDKDPLVGEWKKSRIMLGMKIIIVDFIPTAENIAKYLYYIMKKKLKEKNIEIYNIKIWETPTSLAVYSKNDEIGDNER